MSASPKFGDRVSCLQKLRRGYDFTAVTESCDPYVKRWFRVALVPRIGILIGYRTLQDVRVINVSAPHPRVTFEVLSRQRAALVVFSGCEKPVYVPVDAMVLA